MQLRFLLRNGGNKCLPLSHLNSGQSARGHFTPTTPHKMVLIQPSGLCDRGKSTRGNWRFDDIRSLVHNGGNVLGFNQTRLIDKCVRYTTLLVKSGWSMSYTLKLS